MIGKLWYRYGVGKVGEGNALSKSLSTIVNQLFPCGSLKGMLEISNRLPSAIVKNLFEDRIVCYSKFSLFSSADLVNNFNGIGKDR